MATHCENALVGSANTVLLVFVGMTLFGIAGALWAAVRAARSKS
jgi:hypothetical protein